MRERVLYECTSYELWFLDFSKESVSFISGRETKIVLFFNSFDDFVVWRRS